MNSHRTAATEPPARGPARVPPVQQRSGPPPAPTSAKEKVEAIQRTRSEIDRAVATIEETREIVNRFDRLLAEQMADLASIEPGKTYVQDDLHFPYERLLVTSYRVSAMRRGLDLVCRRSGEDGELVTVFLASGRNCSVRVLR